MANGAEKNGNIFPAFATKESLFQKRQNLSLHSNVKHNLIQYIDNFNKWIFYICNPVKVRFYERSSRQLCAPIVSLSTLEETSP